jgi:hypothetical protein
MYGKQMSAQIGGHLGDSSVSDDSQRRQRDRSLPLMEKRYEEYVINKNLSVTIGALKLVIMGAECRL